MSQSHDQATQSTDQTQIQTTKSPPSTRIRDAMAGEELRSAFDNDGQSLDSSVSPKGSTDIFRDGLAAAFAEENEQETVQKYDPPLLIGQIRGFFSSFDFEDRSDKTKGFMTVSEVHQNI